MSPAEKKEEAELSSLAAAESATDLSEEDKAFADPTKNLLLSDEEYLKISDVEFRARFRERLHHTLEIQTYHAAHHKKTLGGNRKDTVLKLLDIWEKRGLGKDLPEYVFSRKLLGFADALIQGKDVDLSAYKWRSLNPEEQNLFERVIRERRSVRHWDWTRKVPARLIRRVLEAGLWGAHSCNLQSIRYLVVREEESPGLFAGSDIPGGPVHIVLLQDQRVYLANPFNPVRNRLLDCGAAAQNIVLASHAYGLGGCWLTFSDGMLSRLSRHFSLPDHMQLVTYVDVGWPVQTPCPVERISVREALLQPLSD